MDGNFSELELAFIDDALKTHGEKLQKLLTSAIESRKLIKEGALLSGIKWNVGKNGINPHLEIIFPDYGRFIEIGYHKKSSNSNSWASNLQSANSALMGMKSKNKIGGKKKDTRFYAKVSYSSLNKLIAKIMYDYTDKESEKLKTTLQKYNTK
jgi:hypothetical protein